jgi:hypothetical protein
MKPRKRAQAGEPMLGAKKPWADGTQGERPARSAPSLNVADGGRLVVHRDRIARVGVDEREQLAGVLHRLLNDLRAARPVDNTEVAGVSVDAA